MTVPLGGRIIVPMDVGQGGALAVACSRAIAGCAVTLLQEGIGRAGCRGGSTVGIGIDLPAGYRAGGRGPLVAPGGQVSVAALSVMARLAP